MKKEKNDGWCEIKFWIRWCRNEIQDHWDFSDLWFKRNSLYLVFLLLRSYLKGIMMGKWISLITGPGFLLWLRFWLLEKLRSSVASFPIWLLLACFLEQLDILLQQEKWLRCSAGKGSREISFDLIPDTYLTQTAVSALQIKKQGLGTLAITNRGDRIRTCDLVLPKHWVL